MTRCTDPRHEIDTEPCNYDTCEACQIECEAPATSKGEAKQ